MLLLLLSFFFPQQDVELNVTFQNILTAKGSLYVAVYDAADSFMDTQKVRANKMIPVNQTGSMQVTLGRLPPGQYAVSCFHDINGNGKLDTNLFGVPVEPYGFSNNVRPKFRPPLWEEVVFSLKEGTETMSVTLKSW
jgi:uncharacterized protein (DUF2141 family)